MPYATLMYIWEPDRPVGEIITHYNTSRVKMVSRATRTRDLARWYDEQVSTSSRTTAAPSAKTPRA